MRKQINGSADVHKTDPIIMYASQIEMLMMEIGQPIPNAKLLAVLAMTSSCWAVFIDMRDIHERPNNKN